MVYDYKITYNHFGEIMKRLLLLAVTGTCLLCSEGESNSPASSTSSDTSTPEEQSASLSFVIYGRQEPAFKRVIKKALEKRPTSRKHQEKRERCSALLMAVVCNGE